MTTPNGKATSIISILQAGTDIVTNTRCRRVRVQENFTSDDGATTDLTMEEPKGADAVIVLKGTVAVFTAPGPNGAFEPGQTVGVVACSVTGPVEGQQIEDQLV
jgi:hypothetical protein